MALLDQIIGVESGGDPNARNSRSSAGGLGQIIDSTWLGLLAKHRPDIQGTPQGLLALKFDPDLNKQMTDAYAADNASLLSAKGLPVNPGTQYLAHFAGPQGAVNVLQADPNASVETILGSKAVAANPFLKGMTVAELQAWAQRKMGGASSPQPAAQPAPVSPASPAMAIPQQAAPIFAQQPVQQQTAPAQDYFSQFPAEQMAQAPPIFTPPRKPPDLSKLRAALARPSAGFFFSRS